jgi:hypothetical protein
MRFSTAITNHQSPRADEILPKISNAHGVNFSARAIV